MGNTNSTPQPAVAFNTSNSTSNSTSSPSSPSSTISNLASDLKPSSTTGGGGGASESTSKPKPCCVCKDEKAQRDECMLFSKADDPQQDCASLVDQYRLCMKGYGF